jgi:hypothetical protein
MTDLHPMPKTTWGMGEHELMADLLRPVAELVVERFQPDYLVTLATRGPETEELIRGAQ